MKSAIVEEITSWKRTIQPHGPGERQQREFLCENSFLDRVCHERRRAERSSRQFALMLVDGGQEFSSDRKHDLLQTVAATLIESMRGTDIVGWYKTDTVAGVILTEFGDGEIPAALSATKVRVCAALREAPSRFDMERIRISFHVFPEEWNLQDPHCAADSTLHPDLAKFNGNGRIERALKRTMDIAGSLIAILLLLPFFLGIAILIRLTSPGPVLFRQKRIGQYGVPFTFLKFRSMYSKVDATIHENYVKQLIAGNVNDPGASGVYKLNKDPRVTRVGRFLRRTSLDEIPQFLNVLKGEMSLVGPRPPLLYELRAYSHWHRRRLLEAQPGITGLWQVDGRSRVRFDDMVRLDLRYAAEHSFWLDLWILAKTPGAVFSCRGAC